MKYATFTLVYALMWGMAIIGAAYLWGGENESLIFWMVGGYAISNAVLLKLFYPRSRPRC